MNKITQRDLDEFKGDKRSKEFRELKEEFDIEVSVNLQPNLDRLV